MLIFSFFSITHLFRKFQSYVVVLSYLGLGLGNVSTSLCPSGASTGSTYWGEPKASGRLASGSTHTVGDMLVLGQFNHDVAHFTASCGKWLVVT